MFFGPANVFENILSAFKCFTESKKSILFLSGHSHNFERFNVKGKNLLVIGGGVLHQPLHADKEDINDLAAGYKPAFHYLQLKRSGDS